MTNEKPPAINERLILAHGVLAGLTPLIPIPVVDDLVKTYFLRRMVRKLAAANQYQLDNDSLKLLADERESGCIRGCLGTAFLLPLKLIFRKIFFFLEWKRAIDTVSRTYYHGYLLDYAMAELWCAPLGPRSPQEVRLAIDSVLQQVNTSLVERAVRGTFNQSKSVLKGAASLMERSLPFGGRTASEQEVAQAVEAIEEQEEREIQGVVGQLQTSIRNIPAEHFSGLRRELAQQLRMETDQG